MADCERAADQRPTVAQPEHGEEDRALVEATIGWLAGQRQRARFSAKAVTEESLRHEPFYRRLAYAVAEPDPAFLAQGFQKPPVEPRLQSRSPNLHSPIAFAFRLRALLGFGVRAEAMRVILTVDAPWMNVASVAASIGFTKRNVADVLSALGSAGVLHVSELGNEQRYQAPKQNWANFLELTEFPTHRDWPQLFAVYRRVLRWVVGAERSQLSPYMLASGARSLAEEIAPDLRFAGVPFDVGGPPGHEYWEAISEQLLQITPAA